MKKEIETKNDGKEFERFEKLLGQIVKVPKDEILRREKEEKKRKGSVKNELGKR